MYFPRNKSRLLVLFSGSLSFPAKLLYNSTGLHMLTPYLWWGLNFWGRERGREDMTPINPNLKLMMRTFILWSQLSRNLSCFVPCWPDWYDCISHCLIYLLVGFSAKLFVPAEDATLFQHQIQEEHIHPQMHQWWSFRNFTFFSREACRVVNFDFCWCTLHAL